MTEKKQSGKKEGKATKKPDTANTASRAGSKKKPAAKAAAKPPKKDNGGKAAAPAKPEPKKETKKDALTVAPLSGCKVYGQPDPHHRKCRVCKDLQQCLALDVQRKESRLPRKRGDQRGKDFIGFLKGSSKSMFALQIAKNPCHMRDVKKAPWNKSGLTCYDAFNELRRNKSDEGEQLPLAAKNKDGTMFIMESNLSKEQREKMKKEVEEFPY